MRELRLFSSLVAKQGLLMVKEDKRVSTVQKSESIATVSSPHIPPTMGTSSFVYNFVQAVPSAQNSLYYFFFHLGSELMPQDLTQMLFTPFSTSLSSMKDWNKNECEFKGYLNY